MGSLTAAEMTLIGAFAPSVRSSTWLSLKLAVDELNAHTVETGWPRPTLALLCEGDAGSVPAAIEHLVRDLGVSAIVASLDGDALPLAAARAADLGHAVLLSPGSLPLNLEERTEANSWLWYLGGLQRDAVAGYAPILRRGMAMLGPLPSPGLRIVSLVGPSAEDTTLADAIEADLNIDGMGTVALEAFDYYRRLPLDDAARDRAAILDELTRYAPQFVGLFLGGGSGDAQELERGGFVTAVAEALSSSATQPFYVLGPRAANDPSLQRLAREVPAFRRRAVGIDARRARESSVSGGVSDRFELAFPLATREGDLALSADVYDAFYYAAYAAARAGQFSGMVERPGPAVLAEGLASVTDPMGASITVGPGALGLDLGGPLLAEQQPINLVGTTGPAAFETLLQARPSAATLWCFSEAGTRIDLGAMDAVLTDPGAGGRLCAQELLDGQ